MPAQPVGFSAWLKRGTEVPAAGTTPTPWRTSRDGFPDTQQRDGQLALD
jgi:hypothetical protein